VRLSCTICEGSALREGMDIGGTQGLKALIIFGPFGTTESRALTRFRYEGKILGRDGNRPESPGLLTHDATSVPPHRADARRRDSKNGLRQQGSA
jgi:hypothetical protein